MTPDDLKRILAEHEKWSRGEVGHKPNYACHPFTLSEEPK